nr:hypothetical protein [Tanacetum cinerariifolium]
MSRGGGDEDKKPNTGDQGFQPPNLNEIALNFSCQENDSTDVTSMMDRFGRCCSKLQIASLQLSRSGLCMLSLVFGPEVTDASIVAISKCYSNLELVDLSGSSINDSGIEMICNVFPDTLTRLLVSQCSYITSSGIQFATAQFPLFSIFVLIISNIVVFVSKLPESESTELELLQSSTSEKLVLQCSKLESVHAVGYPDVVVQAVQTKVN